MGATESRERRFLEREKHERNIVRNETEHGHYTAAEQHEMMADRYGLKADHVHWKRYRKGQCREPFAPHPDLLPTESLSDTQPNAGPVQANLPYRMDQAVSAMGGHKGNSGNSSYYSGSYVGNGHHGNGSGTHTRGGSHQNMSGYNTYGNTGSMAQPSSYYGPNNARRPMHQYW